MVVPELFWKVHQTKPDFLTYVQRRWMPLQKLRYFSPQKSTAGAQQRQAVMLENPGPAGLTLRQELHELKTMVQGLVK